jgi:hypothetical protein
VIRVVEAESAMSGEPYKLIRVAVGRGGTERLFPRSASSCAAIYTVFTSPTHTPIPNHLPTLIVTPHGTPFGPVAIHPAHW